MLDGMRKTFSPLLWVCASVWVAALACAVPTAMPDTASRTPPAPRSTATPSLETALPVTPNTGALPTMTRAPLSGAAPAASASGVNRQKPVPFGESLRVEQWEIDAPKVQRGAEAWARLKRANSFNKPPSPGYEFVLVQVRVVSQHDDRAKHLLRRGNFSLTGGLAKRYLFGGAVVDDDFPDEIELTSGGQTDGWIVYEVGEGETDLLLIYHDTEGAEATTRYLALEEGAKVAYVPPPAEAESNPNGLSFETPAPVGQPVWADGWEVTVLEALRGDEAWQRLQEANQFNDPPPASMDYVLLRLRVRYWPYEDQWAQLLTWGFKLQTAEGMVWEVPSLVEPEPTLSVGLFAGGQTEGWLALQAAKAEPEVVLVLKPFIAMDDARTRYLSIQP